MENAVDCCLYELLYNGKHLKIFYSAVQSQVEQSILHLGHVSYQNLSH